ncbi:Uncharacterised protein [Serratia fonticola]|uniref:Uncharacterized protein n=1 Tax=Serratia fonticola TaxID=47917 RepID=A0A4U9UFU0_SERFO|nr:Uncharacterised protein [Serratia fonticola]
MNNRKHLTPSEVARLLGATQQGKHAERDYWFDLDVFYPRMSCQ